VVDTPPDRIAGSLRALAENDERRRLVGQSGREYVLKHHSYDAVSRVWERIFLHVWADGPRPTGEWIAEAR
jgi:hypothetical protein